MSKHTRRALPFETRADPDTGAVITRLTPRDVTCHRNYFYQKCFTNDGKRLIFGGEFGPDIGDPAKPNWNYHLLDLESATALQLTEGARENTFGGFLSPNDRYLYFVRAERRLIRLHLDTLAEDVAYEVPPGWVGYGTWVANTACTKMVGIEIHADDWFPLSDWKKFAEMFHRKPRCRLFSVDLATGERNVILEQQGWLGHPQYRPFDDATVAYCHEGPHDLVDARMWFIDEDGTNRRCGRRHAPGESCTHEFWVPDGSAMIFVSYMKGAHERWICSLDPVTLENRRLLSMPPCSHLMSNATGTLIVGDGCGTPADVADAGAHRIGNDPFLHLFDIARGTSRRIAHHDSSWGVYKGNRQVTHPHPSFTPDERKVLFSADGDGEPGLYLVDIPRVNRREFLAAPLVLAACAGLQPRRGPSGWAAAEGGLAIGSVRPEHRLDIRSRADLDRAMALGDVPKLLRVHGRIDLSGGRGAADFADREFDFDAYRRTYAPETWGRRAVAGPLEEARKRSAARQGAAVTVKVAPRTVLAGATPDAGFADGTLMLQDTHEVILSNLRLHGVRDHFPAWDPLDGAHGEWNSEYDAVSLRRARRVWVDHCDFESAHPARERIFGRVFETNDGLLDITLASDLVTVSWCRFARHEKTMLIGGSDRHVGDEGHLRVTLHHNLWEDCAERTPRVRFGKVHVANNLFFVTPGARYGYSIGLGLKARIVSEDNVWETGPEIDASRLVRAWGGTQFSDRGSMHNGRPLALGAAVRRAHPDLALDERPAFDPPAIAERLAAAEVASRVRSGAGAGGSPHPQW